MMADEFNFLWSQIQNVIAEVDVDVIPACCLHASSRNPQLQIKLWG